MMPKHKLVLVLCVVLLGLGALAIAAYPTAFWQIGSDDDTGKMVYKYGDATTPTEHLTIFPDGAIGVGSPTLSDASQTGGQALKLDVDGDIGATIYCNEQGLNCFDITTVFDIEFIADNSAWPDDTDNGIPYPGQEVYNRDCQCVQVYKSQTDSWEPTYSSFMQYTNSDFPLPGGERGDVVFNTDCNCLWCYEGTEWKACGDINSLGLGGFNFDCDPQNPPVISSPFYAGQPATNLVFVPVNITTPQPGPVTLTVNDKGFAAQRTVELDGTEDEILLNPIHYDGSGTAGTNIDFEILSYEGVGSCFARAEIRDPGAFEYDCKPQPVANTTIQVDDTSGQTTIDIPITNVTAGDVSLRVNHNGFTTTTHTTLDAMDTTIPLTINYDGSQTKEGKWSFSVRSGQATGHCFGQVTLDPVP